MEEKKDYSQDYTIRELFEQLKEDESWESDPMQRMMIAEGLYHMLGFAL